MQPPKYPGVGIAVLIEKDGKVLLGRRGKNTTQPGTWAPPGGKLEFGEEYEACAMREVLEETGIKLEKPPIKLMDINDIEDGYHYVSFIMSTKITSGEPKNLEKDKCDGWQWFEWNALPTPLFSSLRKYIDETIAFKNKLLEGSKIRYHEQIPRPIPTAKMLRPHGPIPPVDIIIEERLKEKMAQKNIETPIGDDLHYTLSRFPTKW